MNKGTKRESSSSIISDECTSNIPAKLIKRSNSTETYQLLTTRGSFEDQDDFFEEGSTMSPKKCTKTKYASCNINEDQDAKSSTSLHVTATSKICQSEKFKCYFEYSIDSESKDKRAKCKLCEANGLTVFIKMKLANTSGLKRHLFSRHKEQFYLIYSEAGPSECFTQTAGTFQPVETEMKRETIYLSDPELFEEFSNPKQRLKQETPYNECSSSNSTSPLIQESSTSHSVVNEEAPMAKLVARNKKQRRTIEKKQDQLIEIATKLLTEREEEWDVFGKSVGIQLKSLDPTQGIIAQKLISDILFNAKLGRLCEESTINLKPLSL